MLACMSSGGSPVLLLGRLLAHLVQNSMMPLKVPISLLHLFFFHTYMYARFDGITVKTMLKIIMLVSAIFFSRYSKFLVHYGNSSYIKNSSNLVGEISFYGFFPDVRL